MTSVSLASPPVLSPFDSTTPSSPPRSPQAHRRRPSRNPHAPPLPAFSLGAAFEERSISTGTEGEESRSSDAAMPTSTPAESARRPKPPPLPEFRFNPGADMTVTETSPRMHPVLQEMALNQQRAVRSAKPAPVSAFTFNQTGASLQASPSPTKASFGDHQPAPLRHRRGGSEFVGGGGAEGPTIVTTSPEKPEHREHREHREYRPHPPISGGGRGHAHRRSQAVSISDIDTSELIKVNAMAKARAGSTPTTPSDGAQAFSFPRQSPQLRQAIPNLIKTPPSSPRRRGSAPGIRPRVGFSDHVDVIPRPLSLISSETEGSNSTIRGGHSLNNSINSIASPSSRPSLVVSPSNDLADSPTRPQTADALSTLSPGMTLDANALISLPKRPLSASGPPGTIGSGSPPNKKKHFWFNHSNTSSPTQTPKSELDNPMDTLTVESCEPAKLQVFSDNSRPKTSSGEMRTSSKKRKYHTWTAGIFSRKSEKRSSKAKDRDLPPQPPLLQRRTSERINDIFDADDTVVIREPSPVANRTRPPLQDLAQLDTLTPRQEHFAPARHSADHITSPVLDLDAALGPFGSEERLGGEPSVRNSPAARIAKLHSSERRGVADAFGIVHRRTESAPTMPAVNRNVFTMHRLGSTTSLTEEVFDEEEEDKLLAEENANSDDNLSTKGSAQYEKGDISVQQQQAAEKTDEVSHHPEGLGLSLVESPVDDVIIVDPEDDIARVEARSSNSTIEAPVPDVDTRKRPVSSPIILNYPAPQSLYASSTEGRTTSASMMSSPDVDHVSFDTLSRPNRFLGEVSPDFVLRASNDDLPSLSDSLSSAALPRFSSSAVSRSSVEQRSHSMIVPSTSRPATGHAWKRASLASLNKLIPGSSNGSKLKFETVPDSGIVSSDKAKRKSNRISKLMHFWRAKEKTEK